jgi:hypothetical protein
MIVQIYLNIIRPILSKIIFSKMASQFSENEKKAAQQKLDTYFSTLSTIADVKDLNKKLVQEGFIWKSDPGGGVLDFSPEQLWFFIARKGDDCDGWAEFNYRACKKINLQPRMWILMDGCNMSTSHAVTTCLDPETKKYYLFSNSSVSIFNTEEECLAASGRYEKLKKYLLKT